MENEDKLDGQALPAMARMALLDLINYPDVNPDTVSKRLNDNWDVCKPKGKIKGRIFITSTVEDMDKSGMAEDALWQD
jgi:hypothetical protein